MVGRGRLLEELSAFNIGSLSLTAPPSVDADTSATGLIMGALEGTTSAFALRPLDPTMLYAMADAVADTLSHSYAESTRSKQAGHMKKWANVCKYFDTPVWRTDRAANCGADPNRHVNECVLQAFALLAFYVDMEASSAWGMRKRRAGYTQRTQLRFVPSSTAVRSHSSLFAK